MDISKQRTSGVFLGYLNIGIGAIISLLYTPFMLRILGQSEYGLYTLAYSVVGYLNLLGFGLNGSYLRFCSKYIIDDDKKGLAGLNGTYVAVNSVIGLITLVVGAVIVAGTDVFFASSLTADEIQITRNLLIVLVINTALTFPLSIFSSYITAHERFFFLKGITVLKTVCSPLLCIVVLLSGYRSLGMVICMTAVTILIEVIQAFYCFTKLDFQVTLKDRQSGQFKSIMGFSAFVFLQAISDQLNWSLDSIIIAKMIGSVATAIYGLASTLNGYMRQFSTILASVYAPRANKMVANSENKEDITTLFLKVGRLQFLIVTFVLTGFFLTGRFFISIWGGAGYEDAYNITILLMCALTPAMFLNLGIEIRRAMDMHYRPAIVMLFTAIFNACITIPFVHYLGATGAALGTMVACYFDASYLIIYYKKRLGLNMTRFLKGIMEISLPVIFAFVIGALARQIYSVDSIFSFVIFIVVYTLLFWSLVFVYTRIRNISLRMEG